MDAVFRSHREEERALEVDKRWGQSAYCTDQAEHEGWSGLKLRTALRADNDVAEYLFDLADLGDQDVVNG